MEQTLLMDTNAIYRSLKRIAHQIIESEKSLSEVILVGILTRGVSLAKVVKQFVLDISGTAIESEVLDSSFYRDDLSQKLTHKPTIDFNVTGKKIILIDDVLYTGRTARAAMDALIDKGRPAYIKLAVLVDRGHRELPIRADFVGKNVPTAYNETVRVMLAEHDGSDGVYLIKNNFT